MSEPWLDLVEQKAAEVAAGGGVASVGSGATSASIAEPLIWVGTSETSPGVVSVVADTDPVPPWAQGTQYQQSPLEQVGFSPSSKGSGLQQYGIDLEHRDILPLSEAEQMMYRWWGTETYNRWGDLLKNLGFVEEGEERDIELLHKAWTQAVAQAAMFTQNGHQMTPWGAIRLMAGDEDAIKARRGKSDTGGPRTTRQRHINLTSAQDARGLVRDVLTEQLGRRPTDEEYDAFTSTLNAAERANPSVTTQTIDEDGNVTGHTQGGLGASGARDLLEEEARTLPEYATYQAAAYYGNALFASLDSPV